MAIKVFNRCAGLGCNNLTLKHYTTKLAKNKAILIEVLILLLVMTVYCVYHDHGFTTKT